MTDVRFDGAIPDPGICITREEAEKIFREEFRLFNCWTEKCTHALKICPSLLFDYDRLEEACAKAFGTKNYKILLNPLMMVCYHKKCMSGKKPPVIRLKYVLDISSYLRHLADHIDQVGKSMFKRFQALKNDVFFDSYDEIGPSANQLLNPPPLLSNETASYMRRFGIVRNLNMHYLCWWKNKMMQEGLITSQSLTFQEDDARIYLLLHYPQPVSNWFTWKTLCLYAMKNYSSVSGTSVNLFRGLTNYPNLKKNVHEDRLKFIELVNHPSPSISTIQSWLPNVSYLNEQYHEFLQLVHIRVLSKIDGSLALKYEKVVRYPVVLGIDEQELNQGTYIQHGMLHGLLKKKSVAELREIGLKNLAKHIITECPFLSSVREYRLTDFLGIMCSNVYTQFLAGEMNTDNCIKSLNDVLQQSNRCKNCIIYGYKCTYKSLKMPCSECAHRSLLCESLLTLHVLWDMGSCHVKTEKTVTKITSLSTDEEFCDPLLQTYAFGGLHLAKAITNTIRNYTISFDGSNYGLNILRSLKNQNGPHSSFLDLIKCSVLVGKDRQSDLTSYLTTSTLVQDSLKAAHIYSCVRMPEPVLSYTDNAKKQKKMIMPIGIVSNKNGDIFILDCGASCIHIIDRSSVCKVKVIGTYMVFCTKPYKSKVMKESGDLKLSNKVSDIYISPQDDVFISDPGREEIAILRQCTVASKVNSTTFNILKKSNVHSLCGFGDYIACLSVDKVEIMDLTLPPVSKNAPLEISYQVKKKVLFDEDVKRIFSISPSILGALSKEREVILYWNIKSNKHDKKTSGLKSDVKPLCHREKIVILHDEKLAEINISIDKSNKLLVGLPQILPFDISLRCTSIGKWGKTYFTTSNINGIVKLTEFGQLDFGRKFSESMSSFYDAICYTPPHGNPSHHVSLEESVQKSLALMNLLETMQLECEEKFPNMTTFLGAHGAVYTRTQKCLKATMESVKALQKRMEYLDTRSSSMINPHVILNESLIEHSFGFTKNKGKTELQSQFDYLHNKSRHEVDFLLKLTKLPFCQHVKTKLRDKSYQHVDENTLKSPVTANDLWDAIFSGPGRKSLDKTINTSTLDQAEEGFLRQCYLYTKSVSRKSNRAKWKENSGYRPNMLHEEEEDGRLIKGDLVFCKDPFGKIKKLIVEENVLMLNIADYVLVRDINADESNSIPLTSLLHDDKGLLAVVPSSLYNCCGKEIELTPYASEMVANFKVDDINPYTDEESIEMDFEPELFKDFTRGKKRKAISDDCLDSGNDHIQCDVLDDIGHSKKKRYDVGQWAIAKFVFSKKKVNYYLCQIVEVTTENKLVIQFYREQLPSLRVFEQIQPKETHNEDVIVELIPKTNVDIMCGTKVKLMGIDLKYKCV